MLSYSYKRKGMSETPTKQSEWKAKHTTLITIRLNHNTDTDLLSALEAVPNKQGLIKQLLRDHFSRSCYKLDGAPTAAILGYFEEE